MWPWLTAACYVAGAALMWRMLWLVLVVPLLEVLCPVKLLDRLHNRAVLITGCDSGFGNALARRLDSVGVPVFAGCLLPHGPGAQALARDCSSRLRVLPLDVTSEQQVADAVTAVKAELNSKPDTELWAVVNNAGVALYGAIDELPFKSFEQVFAVNMMGPIRLTKAFLPLLKASRGRVVNVASPLGLLACPLASTYCISKGALIMFSNVLRKEAKKFSVSVCTILPGVYSTPITNVERLKSQYATALKAASSTVDAKENNAVEYCEKILSWFKKAAHEDISDVIDEMVAACVGRNTKNERVTGLDFKISVAALLLLPERLKDLLMDVLYTLAAKD